MGLTEDQKVVVKAINRVRAKAGLPKINKLKRGIPKHAGACPIAMSLEGTGITGIGPLMWERSSTHTLHNWEQLGFSQDERDALGRVIDAVDEGELPELEIPKTPVKIKYPGDRKATVIE